MVEYAIFTKGYRIRLSHESKSDIDYKLQFSERRVQGIVLDLKRNAYSISDESESDSRKETNEADKPEQDPREEMRPKDMSRITDQNAFSNAFF